MRVLLIEPYYTGSHRQWADGLRRASTHEIEIVSLPGQFWRWRLEGAHHRLADTIADIPPADLIVGSSMLDMASFLGLTRRNVGRTPTAVYFHENQVTHPETGRGRHDQSFGLRNIASAAAADAVAFNSEFHRQSFVAGAAALLGAQPEGGAPGVVDAIDAKTTILPVGVEPLGAERRWRERPLVVWNHRWDDDKRLDRAVSIVAEALEHADFDIALLGERYVDQESRAAAMLESLRHRIVVDEFAPRDRYEQVLAAADVVLSTAEQEFFGISMVEGMLAGALPIAPRALSYPEIVPAALHDYSLYGSDAEGVSLIVAAVEDRQRTRELGAVAANASRRCTWEEVGPLYDEWFASITVS